MKKSSIIIRLALALTMIISCFTSWPIYPVYATEGETKVYFEVPTIEDWGQTKAVYCHIYNVYGGTPLKNTSFQSRAELCKKDSLTGLYYFDTATLGTIEDGADYALVFSTKDTNSQSHQTCSITFGKDCLGDTVYVTGTMIENAEDSSKLDYAGAWKNNSVKFGTMAFITSTGDIVGNYFPKFQPREQIVAQFLASWAVTNADKITPATLAGICENLNVEPADVLEQYKTDYAAQLADPDNNPLIAPVETVAALLSVDPNPTTSVFVVAGVKELCGTVWAGSPETSPENIMEAQPDGTYKKVYTDVAVANNYQFMIVENTGEGVQNWIGIDGEKNFVFNVVSVCDVTITFDPAMQIITVTGAGVDIPTTLNIESMRAVGNGDPEDTKWLNGVSWDPADDNNLMTEVAPNVYEITYTDVEAKDNYQVKFAANGSWDYIWGGVYAGSGVESDAMHNSDDNITFEVPYELADVTLRLDLTNFDDATKTGAKFTITVTNKAGSDFTYTVSENGDATITGYTGSATDIVIPDIIDGNPVKAIGSSAFSDCTSLESIEIPSSVTFIDQDAFGDCTSLKSVTFGEDSQLTYIGHCAFLNCTSLESIEIPSSVTSIEFRAFESCTSLTSVTFGEDSQLTTIGMDAFYNCTSLTSIEIPSSVTSIGSSAFESCTSLTSVTFGEDSQLPSIGRSDFYNCTSLTSIEIPSSVTSIGYGAFVDCTSLTSVTFGENSQLTNIGVYAFCNCTSLESITIPGSVTSIVGGAFDGCTSLESIFLPDKDNLTIGLNAIPGTTSQVKYSLDTEKGEVTITEITLGTDKTGVAIPATVCGYPVVAISDANLLTKISSHTCVGGEATCKNKAICGICKQEYGEKNPNNHTGTAKEWIRTETQHKQYWECCDAVVVDYKDHTWNNGVCSVCNYICVHKDDSQKDHECDICGKTISGHTGGTATCTSKASCEYCGEEYGKLDSSNHTGSKVWKTTETQHKQYWECCDAVVVDYEDHTWNNGVCSVCGYPCSHDYDSVVTPPTCTESGYTTHTCANCGNSYVDSEVPATGHSFKFFKCVNCGMHYGCKGANCVFCSIVRWFNGLINSCEIWLTEAPVSIGKWFVGVFNCIVSAIK